MWKVNFINIFFGWQTNIFNHLLIFRDCNVWLFHEWVNLKKSWANFDFTNKGSFLKEKVSSCGIIWFWFVVLIQPNVLDKGKKRKKYFWGDVKRTKSENICNCLCDHSQNIFINFIKKVFVSRSLFNSTLILRLLRLLRLLRVFRILWIQYLFLAYC